MKYKIFAQRTILIFFANLLIGLSGIILLPILTRNLTIGDYGIWVQLTVTINLLSVFIVMGLPSYSMVRFLAGEKDKKKIQNGFYSIAFVILITGLLVSLLFFIFAGQISQILFAGNALLVKILSLILIFSSLNILFQYFFITFQQIKRYSIFLCLKSITFILLVSYFVLLGKGVIGAAIGLLCNEILFFLITFLFIFLEINIVFPKFTELKKYLELSLPTIPGSISYWIVDSSDRYLIGIIMGVTSVGYYSPGYTLGAIVGMFASPITSILTSSISKSYNEKKEEEITDLMKYSIKYYLVMAIPATIGLSVLSKPLLMILSTPEIALNSYLITSFVALAFLLLGLNNIIVNIIILKKKTKLIGVTWLIASIVNLILNLLLIPIFGILGAAIATLIAYSIPFIILSYYSFRFIKLNLKYLSYFKIMLASTPIIIMYPIMEPTNIFGILIFVLVNALIYVILIILLKVFSNEEFSLIKGLFNLNRIK
jgi:O-antigen/teichoic acid export membrane protein